MKVGSQGTLKYKRMAGKFLRIIWRLVNQCWTDVVFYVSTPATYFNLPAKETSWGGLMISPTCEVHGGWSVRFLEGPIVKGQGHITALEYLIRVSHPKLNALEPRGLHVSQP